MNKSFSWRVLTSFGLFLSFFMLLISGVILYIFPGGRGSAFVWLIWGLTKPAWQNQHIIFGFAFSVLSICHLFFINWKAFFSYLKSKTKEGIQSPRELLVIVILSLLFGFGTYYKIQPFSGILEFGKSISKSIEGNGNSKETPARRTESMNLIELSRQPALASDPEALEARLAEAGITVDSSEQTLAEIAAQNGVTTAQLYEMMTHTEGYRAGRHHGHGHDTPQQLAFREEGTESGREMQPRTIAENNSTPMSDTPAPDDELHRRTNARCSSCHQSSRW